jgi:hypothetical protein
MSRKNYKPPPRLSPSPSRATIELETVKDCQCEMARIYRESRDQLIDVQDGSKFIYMLSAMAKVMEVSDMEARITALETESK